MMGNSQDQISLAKALTIAGSDSGGGAGIQADLKTFQELDVYGMSVITALTAQNTLGVQGVYPQSLDCIAAQIDSVLSDIGAHAVKTGMLFSAEIVRLVAEHIRKYGVEKLVVDPVMYAKGGSALLQEEAMEALKQHLLPLAYIITPNIPEACRLIGADELSLGNESEILDALKRLHELGPKYILLKGGHADGTESTDYLYDGTQVQTFTAPRINTRHTHGTGCTLSAAITAELSKGKPVQETVDTAKRYITAAIEHALPVGGGIGPTNHAAYRHYIRT